MKSINLKDEDFVVMTDVVDSDSSIIMATQRGVRNELAIRFYNKLKEHKEVLHYLKS